MFSLSIAILRASIPVATSQSVFTQLPLQSIVSVEQLILAPASPPLPAVPPADVVPAAPPVLVEPPLPPLEPPAPPTASLVVDWEQLADCTRSAKRATRRQIIA